MWYGIKILQMYCVAEDNKVGIDTLKEWIAALRTTCSHGCDCCQEDLKFIIDHCF